jgi:hypothetical protein
MSPWHPVPNLFIYILYLPCHRTFLSFFGGGTHHLSHAHSAHVSISLVTVCVIGVLWLWDYCVSWQKGQSLCDMWHSFFSHIIWIFQVSQLFSLFAPQLPNHLSFCLIFLKTGPYYVAQTGLEPQLWAQSNLPASASWVARTTATCHQTQPCFVYFWFFKRQSHFLYSSPLVFSFRVKVKQLNYKSHLVLAPCVLSTPTNLASQLILNKPGELVPGPGQQPWLLSLCSWFFP